MAWYYGKFSCGCEGRVNVIGPGKDRQWKIDRAFGNMCEECYKKHLEAERKKDNEKSLEKTKEMELPELTGTEKQIAWANTLRIKFIENVDDVTLKYEKLSKEDRVEEFRITLDFILRTKAKASFYIDRRFDNVVDLIDKYLEEAYKDEIIESCEEKEIVDECSISPEVVEYDGIVEIRVTDDKVTAIYEKNDKFKEVVKALGYKWNGVWEKEIDETTGSYIDRAAELGNKLLNEGFIVSIQDEDVRERAVAGDYEQQCYRWIFNRKDSTKLAINWRGMNNSLYNASKKLPGARWSRPSMLVDVSHYIEIEEFAEMYGFKFTKEAIKLIEQYIKELKNVEKVNVAIVEKIEDKNGLEGILNSSRDILNDLVEED